MIKFAAKASYNEPGLVILFDEEQIKSKNLNFIQNARLKSEILTLINSGRFQGQRSETFPFNFNKTLVLIVGLGKNPNAALTSVRTTVRNSLLSEHFKKIKTIELICGPQQTAFLKAVIEGTAIGTYVWDKYLTREKTEIPVREKIICFVTARTRELDETLTICEGVNFSRNLINENAQITDSKFIETAIKSLLKGKKNISVGILNRKELKAKGLNLHLAVNQGSLNEPKLIIVRYTGGSSKSDYTALVGKGITFDTGGLNLKPTGSIETMRCDMSGAAAVIGVLKNTLALNLKRNILFVVGLAENAIDAAAYRPGDVFRGYSGKTVEIGNTDAEGRLVLADALAYIVKNYKPNQIIDVATLTGACVVALGYDYTGLVTNDDKLSRALVHSSNETDDRVWRLPSYPEIKDYIKSEIADIKNTSMHRGAAGALTAAEFLRQFVGDTKWAHLDIAGTAFNEGKSRHYYGAGATGAGVRLLTKFLMDQ